MKPFLSYLILATMITACAAHADDSGRLIPASSDPLVDALHGFSGISPNSQPASAPPALSNPSSTGATSPVAAAAASGISATSMETLDDKHLLAAGDKLSFRIVEDNEDPKPLLVNDNGELEVPYIGRFPVLNKTCRQAAREIKTELEKNFYQQATVIMAVDLLTKTLGRIYLVGSVRIPGPQDVPADEIFTVSKAIMRASGFAEFADKNHVRITRKSPNKLDATTKILVVKVGDVLEKGRSELDIPLEPGDLIYVPNRLVSF